MRNYASGGAKVVSGSVRTRIIRIKRIFTDWFTMFLLYFLPLLKFFGKGSLRGRTFFSKKVFPS